LYFQLEGKPLKQKKSYAGWTLKPGERYNMNVVMEKIIQSYFDKYMEDRIIVLNETDEMVYFVHMHETENKITNANVAMLYYDHYSFLPKEMAMDLAKSYMLQIELTAEAYEYLDSMHGK
jgi:hypothetical protein